MEAERFEDVIRAFVQAAPRRDVLARLFGAALAAGATQGGMGEILARRKRKRRKKKCKDGQQKCGKGCCPAGTSCEEGRCVCPEGETLCDDGCVNLTTDGANCGSCGHTCPSGGCAFGACTCGIGTVCPGTCDCASLEAGGLVCFAANSTEEPCSVDADCPSGSLCRSGPGDPFCSEICTA